MKLDTNELLNIKGGGKTGVGTILFLIFGGLATILAGIIDGITNPSKCRNN